MALARMDDLGPYESGNYDTCSEDEGGRLGHSNKVDRSDEGNVDCLEITELEILDIVRENSDIILELVVAHLWMIYILR